MLHDIVSTRYTVQSCQFDWHENAWHTHTQAAGFVAERWPPFR